MKDNDKNRTYALIGTIVFHTLLILMLCYFTFTHTLPTEDGGVLVQFGNIDAARGTFEPQHTGEAPEPVRQPPTPTPPPQPKVAEKIVTQDIEESVAIEEEKKRKKEEEEKEKQKRIEEERIRKEKEEAERKKQEEERKAADIAKRVAGALGSGNQNASRGTAENGAGSQGSPFGNSTEGKNTGVGGIGDFDLNGRSLGGEGLPRPAYQAQEEGKVVIAITVDPKGNVIMAEIGKGTTIENVSLRNAAKDAAKRAKFNAINGTANQSGTITYRFNLK